MEDKPARLEISATQVAASALASVSAAVAASTLGVAGTIIGAAVISVVATVASAVYGHSLTRTNQRLRGARVPLRARGSGSAEATADTSTPAATVEDNRDPQRTRTARRGPGWVGVAVGSAMAFGLALFAITAVETVTRQPLAAIVDGTQIERGGTTIGRVIAPEPAVAVPGTAEPSAEATDSSPAPDTAPTSDSPTGSSASPPSQSGSAGPSSPSATSPAPSPTSATPSPTPTAGSGPSAADEPPLP